MTINKQPENGGRASPIQEESPDDSLVLIGLGANLPSAFGAPAETLNAALQRLHEEGVKLLHRSQFWHSRPVPVSDQPWFVNAVAAIGTDLPPTALLALLHRIEAEFGRVRGAVNAPRLIDLDLLAYGRRISTAAAPILPHPRLGQRGFVLLPLAEIAPAWRHPVTGRGLASLIASLPADQEIQPMRPTC
jgi:2-amino-4-hydroxy-6-hydroxymethyldihydropteridine diphosphokinase